jgi:hypothetical protein
MPKIPPRVGKKTINQMKSKLHALGVTLVLLLFHSFWNTGQAQTTINTNLAGSTSIAGHVITFGVNNTNSAPINIDQILNYHVPANNGQTWTLWYTATQLTGAPTIAAPAWTQVATGAPVTVTVAAIVPIITGLSLIIPGNTIYRFAIVRNGGTTVNYSSTSSPQTYSAGGVDLLTAANPLSQTYTGAFPSPTTTPRSICGGIVWSFAAPCVSPPTGGNASASNLTPCANSNVTLTNSGHTNGTGQTYQWETSPTLAGPYTPIPGGTTPNYNINVGLTSAYYQLAITCNSMTTTSVPVLLTVPALYPGGTYTINSVLPTGGGNFASFSDAAAAINCGIAGPIVLNVSPGTYTNDKFYLDSTVGGSPTNTITINGNGATLSGNSIDANNRAVLRLNGADYVSVNNLNIISTSTGTTQYGFGVQLLAGADFNSFTNCAILVDSITASTNYGPIVISGSVSTQTTSESNCDNNSFTGNIISGGYYSTVLYGNAAAPLVNGNTFTNNSLRNFYFYGFYIYGSNGTVMEGNDISRPNRTNTTTFAGIIFSGLNRNALFNRNVIHNAFDAMPTNTSAAYAIYSSSSDGSSGNANIISNNLVHDINHAGVTYGIYNVGSDYYNYYHNTISLDNIAATSSTETRGIFQTTAATGLDFKNNIISVTRGGNGIKHGIYMATAGTTWTASNNDYYVAGGGFNYIGNQNAATDYATLAAWQAATSKDAGSLDVAPLFGAGSYVPTNTALDNMGISVGITTDLSNAARSATTPDIGAYEFTPPACSGVPLTPTATINGSASAAICMNISAGLALQGYSVGGGISYQWYSSPVGQNNWSVIPGATNPIVNVPVTGPLDYRAIVTCGANTATSNTVTSSVNPFYLCYCSPLTGVVLQTSTGTNYTTNVAIVNTPLNSSVAMTPGGYTQANFGIATNTATLFQGTTYTINVTQSTASANSEIWIDWDQSGTFDVSEYSALTMTGTVSSATFTVPLTAVTGLTGLRVRTAFQVAPLFTASGACANQSLSREIEDYVITVLPAPTCVAPTGLVSGGATTTDITVNWTASVSAPVLGYEYYYSTANVAPTATTTPSGSVAQGVTTATITGLNSGTPYYVWVRSSCGGNDYSIWAGPLSTNTLLTNDEASGAIPVAVNPDYDCGLVTTGTTIGASQSADPAPSCNATGINDDVWYSFTATNTDHRITIYGMTQIVGVALYTGSIGSLTQVPAACGASTVATTASNVYVTGLSVGITYYARVFTTLATAVTSNFTICVGTAPAAPPINDPCTNAIDISNQQPLLGSMGGATQTQAPCNAQPLANDVWYSFTTGTVGGNVTITGITTYADIVMEAFSGICGSLTPISACVDAPAIGTETFTVAVAASTTYYIRVYGFNVNPLDQGTFIIQVVGTPLAIKLADISATNVGSRNRIDWSTISETLGDRFDIQTSTDGRNYVTLATIEGKGGPSVYSYWHETPVTGRNYYRLYMKDASGNGSYSREVTAVVKENKGFTVTAHPNPVADNLQVSTSGNQGANPSISVVDITGKVVATIGITGTTTEIDMRGLAKGVYSIRYIDETQAQTIKVVKQ